MKKILVIGESCRDIFVYCNADRLCPDIPVPVLSILNQTENEGMALNVYKNIKSLLPECDIITNKNWKTITKTRYIHSETNHMFIRIDSDHKKIPKINLKNINLKQYELIAISDYNKGFLSELDIKNICNNHNNVFVDTKKILGDWCNNAKIIKINNFEFNNSVKFIQNNLIEKIIHTKGSEGCYFKGINYPVNKVEVKDSTGAGDSFFAALVSKYLETNNIKESIIFANKCASEVVKHKGVTII